MRPVVFAVAALQLALLIALAAGIGPSDPAGNAMSTGLVTLAGIVMAVLLSPALILAINRKALRLAMGLSILSLAVVIGISTYA